jgi:hypothetical protein
VDKDRAEGEAVDSGKVAPPHGTAVPPEEPVAEGPEEIEMLEDIQEIETPEAAKELESPAEDKELESPQEAEETETPKKAKKAKKVVDIFADEKKADMTPLFAILAVFGLTVVFLLIAWLGYLKFSTAVYFGGLAFIPLLLWMGRKANTVYVVFLGVVIAALMTGIYFLWGILADGYHFDLKASEAKQRVGMIERVAPGWQFAIHDHKTDTFADC